MTTTFDLTFFPPGVIHQAALDYGALIEKSRIHGSLYTSEQIYRDELERIFYGGWVFAGHDSEIPKPGDYVTREIGVEPILMLRDRDGEVRVFANRCMHRGNKLCSEERGNKRALTCDYHGWTFALNGDLAAVPYPGGFTKDKSLLGLRKPARTELYRGFVFITLNPESPPLAEHLGHGAALIDRAADMSPTGRLRLDAGWVKQHYCSNWKMLPENDTDGYHANHVHSSFLRVFRSQYDAIKNREEERLSRVVDWGGGHTAIDAGPMYTEPFEWLGVKPERIADYTAAMVASHGDEKAQVLFREGPPHAVIFPNLFLGEMNIVMFQPLNAAECVQWHTPMLLDGVSDSFNARLIRQSEAAMGPSAFLLADDQIISERQQLALQGRSEWLELSRGLEREVDEGDGVTSSHISDETSNRGFWSHYRAVMSGARPHPTEATA